MKRFITANTQELAKDKWLCPLSGKKFKGPEFVRKHILNKHVEKVDEVKVEVCTSSSSCHQTVVFHLSTQDFAVSLNFET